MIEDWDALLHKVAPRGDSHILDGMADLMPQVCAKIELTTKERVAAALARWSVETGGFTHLEENLRYSARRLMAVWPKRFPSLAAAQPFAMNPEALAEKVYGNRKDLGNTHEGDGWRYRGGGITQTTGRFNYRAAGFEDNPDTLRSMPHALLSAAAFWQHNRCNEALASDGIDGVSKRINGGTQGMAETRAEYKRILPIVTRFWDAPEEVEDDAPEPVPATAKGGERLSKERLAGVQKRLVEIGYKEVGKIDGLWGGRTAGAIVAFKNDRGLKPLNATTDEAFLQALSEPFVRPVSDERATATARTLVAEGSRTVVATQNGKALGIIGIVVGAVKTAYAAVSENIGEVHGQVAQWREYLPDVPGWMWGVVVVGGCYLAYRHFDTAEASRVDDERTGKTA